MLMYEYMFGPASFLQTYGRGMRLTYESPVFKYDKSTRTVRRHCFAVGEV